MPDEKDERDVETASMKIDRDDEQEPVDEEKRTQRSIKRSGEPETDALGNAAGAS